MKHIYVQDKGKLFKPRRGIWRSYIFIQQIIRIHSVEHGIIFPSSRTGMFHGLSPRRLYKNLPMTSHDDVTMEGIVFTRSNKSSISYS